MNNIKITTQESEAVERAYYEAQSFVYLKSVAEAALHNPNMIVHFDFEREEVHPVENEKV